MQRWMKGTQVMEYLQISRTTLWRLVQTGKLHKYAISANIVRYDRDEVIRLAVGGTDER